MSHLAEQLHGGLELSIHGKPGERQASMAISEDTRHAYISGEVVSKTKLLHVQSEQAALLLAVQRQDFGVERLITMQEAPDVAAPLLPSTAMIMIDYVRRTGRDFSYAVLDTDGRPTFEVGSVHDLVRFYRPGMSETARVTEYQRAEFEVDAEAIRPNDLRELALRGLERAFTTTEGASGYGAVAVTEDDRAFISGQYSSFDGRTNVHAEMGAVINAVMNHGKRLTALGVISTKHVDKPAQMCGCCRQFMTEFAELTGCDPALHTFSLSGEVHDQYKLDEYLPDAWSSAG